MASTCTGQSPSDVAQRWSKKEKKMLNIQRPFSVKLYNQHMGGVDLMDQCVAMYPHRRKNKRWYIKVFFHFLDVTTDPSRHAEEEDPVPPHLESAEQCPRHPPEIRFGSGNHWPQLTEAKNANRCQDAACTRKTKYICMQCCVALCPGCFANYHGR
ncbi:PiggyBac transposable element-derived protein 3 [Dissostichus eleginoides]|uniref:PiggyBac transposable element-derived protein 3 n=1 Tax=Dissostichus eleginoides TaxID=100907 RepID=A0AAD9FK56_DISEL|nr:PiggyBac transposable element-derived protein 3 [Dissostichus eleginoides]